MFCRHFLVAKEALWKDVSELEDPIQMDYDVVEELFSRKTAPVAAAPKGAAEKKQPTEVSRLHIAPFQLPGQCKELR